MKIQLEIDEKKLRELIYNFIQSDLSLPISKEDITIEVKSKQNYKSEWESAQFRAVVNKLIFDS